MSARSSVPGSPLGAGLRLIARQLRQAPRGFVIGGIGAVLYGVMTVVSSVVLGDITDRALLGADEGRVRAALVGAGVVMAVALAKAVGVVGRRLGAYIAQYALQAGDRRRVTRSYLSLGLPWHRRHAAGTLLSNASSDVESAAFVAAPLPMALAAAVMLAVTAVLLVVSDPFLAAIGFVIGPLIALANYFFSRRMRAAAGQAQSTRGDVAEVAHESFDAALVVKTLGRERAEIARFDGETGRLRDHLIILARLRAVFDPVVQALPNLGILAIVAVGAWRVGQGSLSTGELVSFAYLFRLVAMPMRVFGWLLGNLPQAVAGFDRVSRVLEADEDMVYGSAPLPGDGPVAVTATGVSFEHPASSRDDLVLAEDPAAIGDADDAGDATGADAVAVGEGSRGVTGVDLDVAPGRTIAVVGATGSGKSTLATLLVRLVDPDTGTVRLDDVDLRDVDRDALASSANLVFQEAFLFDASIRDNITLGGDFTDGEVRRAARLARIDGLVADLDQGWDTVVGERGASLSGGQRQRVALARALVRRPRLLVLDDATSAVDPTVEQEILNGMADADMATTVVVVAYRRGSIALADEVVFVRDGRVAARGTHDHLMATDAAYSALVAAYEHDRAAQPTGTSAAGPSRAGVR